MSDNDPIEELADTLYRSLSGIHPFAEVYFAEQREGLQNAVRGILDQASAQRLIQQQLDETAVRAMDFRNGMAMEIEPARELAAAWIGAARALLGDAPNYTETLVEMETKVAESPERFVFVLQRVAPGALTPHQAREGRSPPRGTRGDHRERPDPRRRVDPDLRRADPRPPRLQRPHRAHARRFQAGRLERLRRLRQRTQRRPRR